MSASGAASDSAIGGLAITAGGFGQQQMHDAGGAWAADRGVSPQGQPPIPMNALGPQLAIGMLDAQVFERLNAWGVARDGQLLDLRAALANTQAAVGATFMEARGTLLQIVHDFRLEAETMRSHGAYESAQSLARLDQVVSEARVRFDAQDARVTQDLGDLAQHVAAQLQQTQQQQQPQQQQQQQQQHCRATAKVRELSSSIVEHRSSKST